MCTDDAVKEWGFVICTVYQLLLGDQIKGDKMGGAYKGDAYSILLGVLEGKKPSGTRERRYKDNIKADVKVRGNKCRKS